MEGNITLNSIASFIDNKNFNFPLLFKSINKINSNNEKKSELDHFISIIFGKLAEIFVYQKLKEKINAHFTFSPLDEKGYEICDLMMAGNKTKTIEIRSSFQKHISPNLNHIIKYLNDYKKVETYKDYYFQVFFQEDRKILQTKLTPLFQLYKVYEQQNHGKFKDFLIHHQVNLDQVVCKIVNKTFISKQEILNGEFEIKQLNQRNTQFEAKSLKDCKTAEEGLNFIQQDFLSYKKTL